MKKFICIGLIVFAFVVSGFGQTAKVNSKDLKVLTGAQWMGTLTYLDYKTEKKVSLSCNLTVTQSKKDKSSWVFAYQYPNEPNADSAETVAISKDGKIFDGEMVIESTKLPDNTLKIVTEKSGSDNYKKALFRFTYLLSKTSFSTKKEVKYEDTTEFFVRNEYGWKR